MVNSGGDVPVRYAGCEECDAADAQPVTVEFTDGTTDTINLCERCVRAFRDADFVERLVPPNEDQREGGLDFLRS